MSLEKCNVDGSVQSVQLFAPFGGTRYSDGSITTPYNYTGQRLDSTSGLLYYGARYYDSTSGRFISADSVETNGTGLDAYAYVKGSPETFTDPTGHGRCGPDGDCVGVPGPGTPGQPPAPEPTQPGVGGSDDACHNMALCGGGGGSTDGGGSTGGGGSSGGDGQCHGGCKGDTLSDVTHNHNQGKNTCDQGCKARKALLALWDKSDKQASIVNDILQLGLDVTAGLLELTLPSPLGGLGALLQFLGSFVPHLMHLAVEYFTYKNGSVPIWVQQMQVVADQFAVAVNIVNAGLGLISLGLLDFEAGGVAALKLIVQKSLAPMVISLVTAASSGVTESTDERQLLRLQMSQNNDAWAIKECHAERVC